MGAKLGEWSKVYGSNATKRKVYLGKVTNWFSKLGVAEITVETTDLHKGDTLIAIGATTGVVEFPAEDIRLEYTPVEIVPKSSICSVKVEAVGNNGKPFDKLHRGDKIFIWKDA